jgi:hypothetical protein
MHTISSNDKNRDGQLVDTRELTFDVRVTFVIREEHLLRIFDAQYGRCGRRRKDFEQRSSV